MRFSGLGLSKTSIRHAATPWGITTSVVGFTCDVLKPEGNLAPYLLIVSVLGFLAVMFIIKRKSKTESRDQIMNSSLGGFLSFFALSAMAWIVISVLFIFTPKDGLAAKTIPGVEYLQKDLLKIGQDVTEIKGTVTRIEEKIDALAKTGTVIPNPKTPEEFYHNARFYEVKGNTGEAEKSYQKFLELAPNYVDAHLAYQILMNNTQGVEVTRQFYADLQNKNPDNPVVALMAARLIADRSERLAKLNELAKKYESNGPIFFELAQEYLKPGAGNITIDDMTQAKAAYAKFNELDKKGAVKPFYIDKQVLDEVYKKRDEYERMVTAFYGSMIDRPIEIKVELIPGNKASLAMIPKEQKVQKIFYSIDDPNPTIDTGVSPWLKDPMTGAPMPNYQVTGTVKSGKHILYVKYINAQGKESPVYSQPFEVTNIQARFFPMPGELGSTKLSFMVDFQSLDGRDYQWFYGVDDPSAGQKASGENVTLKDLPPGAHELFYYGLSGGEKTPVLNLKLSK